MILGIVKAPTVQLEQVSKHEGLRFWSQGQIQGGGYRKSGFVGSLCLCGLLCLLKAKYSCFCIQGALVNELGKASSGKYILLLMIGSPAGGYHILYATYNIPYTIYCLLYTIYHILYMIFHMPYTIIQSP